MLGKKQLRESLRFGKLLRILLSSFLFISFTLSGQTVWYVKHNAAGANNGTSWTDAYPSLQSAITAASSGQVIWVAAGTYSPSLEVGGTGVRYRAFQLKNGVTIYGGFIGNETLLNQRDFTANETILSGTTDNVYHVFRHVDAGLNNTAVLDGFTITGGNANGASNDANGGGMLNQGSSIANGSSPTATNCKFQGNSAVFGGAMYNSRYCHPVVSNTSFITNSASTNGGAVYNNRNNPSFTGCTFTTNSAAGVGDANGGGAMFNNTQSASETITISNCTFTNNSISIVNARGGAIFNNINPGIVNTTNCLFIGNTGRYGAGIYNSAGSALNATNSTIAISQCTFTGNEATYGAGMLNDVQNTIVKRCEFKGNNALQHAGGIYNRYGSPLIINCLFSGGKAVNYGGGIYNNNASPVIINTTISGNISERGGAIAGVSGSNLEIKNSILWGNVASIEGNELNICSDCGFTANYSLYSNSADAIHIDAGGTFTPTNCLTSDPLFYDPLSPTSGNTPNLLGNYRVAISSPAIDAGLNSNVPSGNTTDLPGADRFIDGNGDSNADVDMGAYELDPATYIITWSGSTNQDWNTASNWIPHTVPVSTENATIPNVSNDPVVNQSVGSPATCNNLTIENGAELTVAAAKALTVHGTLTNNSGNPGLVIKSDATGTGSLIQTTGSISATVERYIPNDFKWHFLSSPVDAQAIWPQFSPTPTGLPLSFGPAPWSWDFYYWNPNADVSSELYWVNLRQTSGSYNDMPVEQVGSNAGFGVAPPNFLTARGYLVAYNTEWNPAIGSPSLHPFTGTLHAGTINKSITFGSNVFNLIGNPYPSSIDWKAASGWTRNTLAMNSGGYDLWIFNDQSGNYGVYNSASVGDVGTNGTSRYIAPMQGFFVKANASGTLSMTPSIQTHSAQTWLKEEMESANILTVKLTTTANSFSDEMMIEVNENHQNGGSDKLSSIYPEAPEIFSMKNNQKFSIDRLTRCDENTVITLGIKAGVTSEYKLHFTGIEQFTASKSVVLEDLTTGYTQEINKNPEYSFNARPGDPQQRFQLHFGSTFGIQSKQDHNGLHLSYSNHSVHASRRDGQEIRGIVIVYNTLGQQLIKTNVSSEHISIPLNVPIGYYVIRIITNDSSYTTKILIK